MFTWLAVLISPLCKFNCGRSKVAAPIIWVVISDLFICWSPELYFNPIQGLWSSVGVLFLLKFRFDMANIQFSTNTHGIMSGIVSHNALFGNTVQYFTMDIFHYGNRENIISLITSCSQYHVTTTTSSGSVSSITPVCWCRQI